MKLTKDDINKTNQDGKGQRVMMTTEDWRPAILVEDIILSRLILSKLIKMKMTNSDDDDGRWTRPTKNTILTLLTKITWLKINNDNDNQRPTMIEDQWWRNPILTRLIKMKCLKFQYFMLNTFLKYLIFTNTILFAKDSNDSNKVKHDATTEDGQYQGSMTQLIITRLVKIHQDEDILFDHKACCKRIYCYSTGQPGFLHAIFLGIF